MTQTPFMLEQYYSQSFQVIKRIVGDNVSDKKIKAKVLNKISENLKDPKVVLDNNYKNTQEATTLLQIVDLIYSNNFDRGEDKNLPIFTGYGTLYKSHGDLESNLAKAIKTLLDLRKVYKKKMFNHINDKDKTLFKYYKLIQLIYKLLANSIYGVLGQGSAIFYNMYSAPSITYTGVLAVTTAVASFEAFLGNNFKFKTLDDVTLMINKVCEQKYEYDYNDIFTEKEKISNDQLYNYLKNKCIKFTDIQFNLLQIMVDNLTEEECTKIYYKNNFLKFLETDSISENFISQINYFEFENGKPKEDSVEVLESLYEVVKEWCIYLDIPYDRYEIAMTFERSSSIVTDTDSTFLNLEPYILSFYNKYQELNPDNMEQLNKMANTLIFVLSKFIALFMEQLSLNMNVPDEFKNRINMKSEYLYKRLLLTPNKKSYAGILIAQEGIIIEEPELDIKGLSIKKAGVNKPTRDFFTKILEDKILKSKEIDMYTILRDFKTHENTIIDQITNKRNPNYLIPAKSNSYNSYKEPYTIGPFRGVLAWNEIYPNETIQLPAQVYKIPLTSDKNIASLKPLYDADPEKFEIIKNLFYDGDERLANYGFNIMCVPKDIEEFPKWILPLIDVEKITSLALASAEIILKSLGSKLAKTTQIKKSSDKRLFLSNVIEF